MIANHESHKNIRRDKKHPSGQQPFGIATSQLPLKATLAYQMFLPTARATLSSDDILLTHNGQKGMNVNPS